MPDSKSTRLPPSARRASRRSRRFVGEVAFLEDRRLLSDMTAPTTTATPVGTLGSNGYYTSPVSVNLSATDVDDVASALSTEFRVNDGPLTTGKTINLTADGSYNVQYFSMDPAGNVEATHTLVVKIDQTPPDLSVMASPTSLWPPNGKFVAVTVSGNASDQFSGVNAVLRDHVTDEYRMVQPSGTTSLAPITTRSGAIASGSYSFTVMLQARRAGRDHDGRQYEVFVTATDLAGNSRTVSALVIVPHDQGNHSGNPGFGGRQGNLPRAHGNENGRGHSHHKVVANPPASPSPIVTSPGEDGHSKGGDSGGNSGSQGNDQGHGDGNANGNGHGDGNGASNGNGQGNNNGQGQGQGNGHGNDKDHGNDHGRGNSKD